MSRVVKRKGHKEEYDNRKVYASVYAACLNVHMHQGEAELVADKVAKEIDDWVKTKEEVTAHEIFLSITQVLKKYNPDASFMYETHRDVS